MSGEVHAHGASPRPVLVLPGWTNSQAGHINLAAGYGSWPAGEALLATLLARAA